jgi:hypothetical protein
MLFKKGDWVWFIWKHGVELLPVGEGYPCIPITPQWTCGPGLSLTTEGLVHRGPSMYNTLALATSNNHTCIDANGEKFIYLCSFTHEQLKIVVNDVRNAKLWQMNQAYEHWGAETKRRIDAHTIQFINRRLEDQPMKAKDKVKSVTATLKVEVNPKEGTSFTEVARKVTKEIPVWKHIKYEIRTVNGKKRRVRVNKWKKVGTKEVNISSTIVKPDFVYKTPRRTTQPAKHKHTPCPKRTNLTYRFKDAPERIDVGVQTFNEVKYAIKRHTKITDDKILNRLAEFRFIGYPKHTVAEDGKKSTITMRQYAKMINEKSDETLRKEVLS